MDATLAQTAARADDKDILWRPALIVFVGNVCMMLIQMCASRIAAPIVGVSLYSWTTIIGVMLAGISLGNYLGGRLADRFASRRWLGAVLILSAVSTLSIIVLVEDVGLRGLSQFNSLGVPLIVRMILLFAALFGIPSVFLGLISPTVLKLALRDLASTGSDVGRIYAAGTIGGIVGTFLTGFYLISLFGSRNVLIGAAAVLVFLGIAAGAWVRSAAALLIAGAVAAGALVVSTLENMPLGRYMRAYCTYESNYFCIRVREETADGNTYKVLALDHLVHSYSNKDNPADLRYPYEQIGSEASQFVLQRDGQIRFLLLGGGGFTMPRYLESKYTAAQAEIDVVEIDPKVIEVAKSDMGVAPDSRVRAFDLDARQYLAFRDAGAPKYNIIQADAFNDFSVPYHLTTREFGALVKRHLTDDGLFLVNMIDGGDTEFAKALIRTVGANFPNLYFVPTNRAYDGIRLNTMLLIASGTPLDEAGLRAARGHDERTHIGDWLVPRADLDAWLAKGRQLVLTDEYVPTDNLLMPTFELKLAR